MKLLLGAIILMCSSIGLAQSVHSLSTSNLLTDGSGNDLFVPGFVLADGSHYTLTGATVTSNSTTLTPPSTLPSGLVSGTYPLFGPSLQSGSLVTYSTSTGAFTLSKPAAASASGNYTLVSPASTASVPQGLQTGELNSYLVDVVNRYGYELNAGLMIADCLSDASLPVGTVCDARGIISLQSGGVVNLGTGIIEVGYLQTQSLILPDYAVGILNTPATYIGGSANYIPPSATVTAASGGLPSGVYYYQIAYRTGEGRSLPSTEGTIALSAPGGLAFALPACPQYAADVNVYVSSASGGEMLQGNGACNSTATISNAALFLATEIVPNSALPLPAIILHQNKSAIYSTAGAQSGFVFKLSSSFAASGMLATVGNGYSDVHNLFFYNNTANASMKTVFYDVGAYALTVRRKILVSAGSNQVGIKRVGQYNDVVWEDSNAVCAQSATSNCVPLMDYATPMNEGDTESWHTNNWIGGLIGSKTGSTAPGVVIQGRSSAGQAIGTLVSNGLEGDRFWGTSFETSTPGAVIQITDANNVSFSGVDMVGTGVAGTSAIVFSYTGVGVSTTSACGVFIGDNSSVAGFTNLFTDQTDPTKSYTPPGGLLTSTYSAGFTYNGCVKNGTVFAKATEQSPQQYDAGSPLTTQSAVTELAAPFTFTPIGSFSGTTTLGSNAISLTTAPPSGVTIGNYVLGSGLPADASIVGIDAVNNRLYLSGSATTTNNNATAFTAVTIVNAASTSSFQTQSSFAVMPAGSTALKSGSVNWGAVAAPISFTAPDSGSRWLLSPSFFMNLSSPMSYSSNFGKFLAGVAVDDLGVYPISPPRAGSNFQAGTLTFWNTSGVSYVQGCQLSPSGIGGSGPLILGGINCTGVKMSVPATFNSVGSGVSVNTDLAGTLVIAAGATVSTSYTFTGSYTSTPICSASLRSTNSLPLTNAAVQALNGILPTISTAALSFAVGSAPASALTVPYTCIAQN